MTRAEKINQILQGRQKMADRTEKTMECVRSVASALDDCAALLEKVIEILEGEQRAKAEQLQRELVRSINEKIPKIHQGVSQLWLRFRRPTFNIGIIGNARQGKSTFLQAITGLTNDEIPADETDHCTGAPSVIINDSKTYADVEFYDERSFLDEMILPFYEKLGLTPRPATFRSFADNPLPALQSTSANYQQLWQKLKDRHENSSAYQNLLRQPVKRIERHEFIDYIAQQKQQKEGESFYIEKIYNWIAVKMVTIHCPFNVPPVVSPSKAWFHL